MTPFAENQDRREAARELTNLLNQHPAFSFVRLGDGEVKWMRQIQNQQHVSTYQYFDDAVTSVELVRGATGAKVLCHELASELGIRAIDFGSMLRALTYADSSRYHACRDMHNPFLFRVPMPLFMPALERAHPDWSIVTLTAKAHAQIVLDLHRHEKFAFNTSEGVDGGGLEFSRENLRCFHESRRHYTGPIRHLMFSEGMRRLVKSGFLKSL